MLSLNWTVSTLISDLFCWTSPFCVGLCFFVYISFFYLKPLHIWFSTWNKGVVASYSTSLVQCFHGEVGHWKQITLGYVGVLEVDLSHGACHWKMWHVLSGSTWLRLLIDIWGNCLTWALCFMHFPASHAIRCLARALTTIGYFFLFCFVFFLLFTSLKSRVTGWRVRHSPSWAVSLMQLSGLSHSVCCFCQSAYLRCAIHILRVSRSWPMWTVFEPRNSSLATVNQLRAW